MRPAPLPVPDALDDTGDLASLVAAPWMGVLWLGVLPLRLVQAELVSVFVVVGDDAAAYGDLLRAIAAAAAGAFVLATLGRAVFARACVLALRTGRRPGREALAVGLTPFLTHLYLALVAEVLFLSLFLSVVAVPLSMTMAALAAATAPLAERPGLVSPLRELGRGAARPGPLLALVFVFGVAFVIAFANVGAVFFAGLWLAGAVPGVDVAPWVHRLAPGNPPFLILVTAGAVVFLEPFWIAAHVVLVHRARSRETGQDLRAWFERLRRPEAA